MSLNASPESTARHAARQVGRGHPEEAHRPLGQTGLVVSRLGFGGQRLVDGIEEHERALRRALGLGVNLIDTSASSGDGGSERLIGRVVGEAGRDRSELVLVSKAGFILGSSLEVARARAAEGRPDPETLVLSPDCWYSLHPDVLDEQLEASLERLGGQGVDVYLLHDPECVLAEARRRKPELTIAELHAELDERLRLAFAFLEGASREGRIGWYGVSSNTFGAEPLSPEKTCPGRMASLAEEVARQLGETESRFAVVQMPLNLLEAGPVLHGAGGESALEVAHRAGLGVLTNRPLNAFAGGALVRLADFAGAEGTPELGEAAERVVELEEAFREQVAPALEALPGAGSAGGLFIWGHELPESAGRFAGVEHWREAAETMIRPRLQHALEHVELHLVGKARLAWEGWVRDYEPAVCRLLEAIDARYRAAANLRNQALRAALDPLLPAPLRGQSLSRKALAVAAGARGVSSVLVGMRRDDYVDDAVGMLELPLPDTGPELFARFSSALVDG